MKSNSPTWRHTTWSRSAASKISSHSSSRTPSTWPPALGGVSSTGSRIGWRTWKDRLTAGHDELLFRWSCSLVISDLVAHKNKRFLVIQLQLRHFFKAFFVVLIFAPQLSCDLWWCLFFIDRFCKGSSLTRSWSAVKWVTEKLFTMTECNEWRVNQTDVDISGDPVDGVRWWCSYWKRLPETEGHHQAGISQPFYVVRLFYKKKEFTAMTISGESFETPKALVWSLNLHSGHSCWRKSQWNPCSLTLIWKQT